MTNNSFPFSAYWKRDVVNYLYCDATYTNPIMIDLRLYLLKYVGLRVQLLYWYKLHNNVTYLSPLKKNQGSKIDKDGVLFLFCIDFDIHAAII